MKKTAIMFFVFFVFVCCKNVIAENISSEELMKCLLSEDAQQIKGCLAQKFPNFVKSRFEPYDAITIASCHSSEIEHQEYCTKAKEYLSKELNDLLNVWALLSLQCSQSMNPENCISQIDISRCSEYNRGQDEDTIGSVIGPGACYGLAAFLKKSVSICQNQFYLSTEMNCESWLALLSLDCKSCDAQTFTLNDQGYFNWVEGDEASMRDISFCMGMTNQEKGDDCFLHAAVGLRDESYCARVSEELLFPGITSSEMTRRDACYSMTAREKERKK